MLSKLVTVRRQSDVKLQYIRSETVYPKQKSGMATILSSEICFCHTLQHSEKNVPEIRVVVVVLRVHQPFEIKQALMEAT